jgi:Zn-dependent protease with chaperone function
MVSASYFDGRSTRVRPVTLSVIGDDLAVAGADIDLRIPFASVKVDERLGQAPRRLRFPDGAFCEVRDLEALDVLLASTSHRDGQVDRLQRQLKTVLFALVACVALAVVGYKIGLPWAAEVGARHLPPAVGRTLTTQTLQALDGRWLLRSKLALERRETLSAKFHALALPEGGTPQSRLLFRRSPQLGANAFTLPDGTIVLLDDLVTSINDDQQILAVLAHELGHAHGHHGLQLLLRTSVVGAFLTLYVGDISHLLAAAPAALVQAHYSQDLEREADDYGAALLSLNGMSPGLLADVLQSLTKAHPSAADGSYLASHPSTRERIQHLRSLAATSGVKPAADAAAGNVTTSR